MAEITIENEPGEERLEELGVRGWPTWQAAVSTFPWTYDEPETCFFLEGDVIVTPDGGEPVRVGKGQLVTFPAGMSCTWDVRVPVHKHYRFG
jgi:uncharacterized cupin superfamily protein